MTKKLIAITQRIYKDNKTNEIRDCLDQRWVDFIKKCDFNLLPLSNKIDLVGDYLSDFSISGIILSGGGDIALPYKKVLDIIDHKKIVDKLDYLISRDLIENKLIKYSLEKNIPLLGICRGMQAINAYYGGNLIKVEKHVRTIHRLDKYDKDFKDFYPDKVNSFHDFAITSNCLSRRLKPTAFKDNIVEAFVHKDHNQYGIMWHPERELNSSYYDLMLIKRVFRF